eukprot:tig00000350_g24344.t1
MVVLGFAGPAVAVASSSASASCWGHPVQRISRRADLRPSAPSQRVSGRPHRTFSSSRTPLVVASSQPDEDGEEKIDAPQNLTPSSNGVGRGREPLPVRIVASFEGAAAGAVDYEKISIDALYGERPTTPERPASPAGPAFVDLEEAQGNQTFDELLESVHEFPCEYIFKAVGTGGQDFVDGCVSRVGGVLGRELSPDDWSFRESGQKKYHSVTFTLLVESAEQILKVYDAIKEDPRLKFIL